MAQSELDRRESLKAAVIAGLSFLLADAVAQLINFWLLTREFEQLATLAITHPAQVLVKAIISLLTGSLFGITYRYIIRRDSNPHLKDGAVLAFGLVRAFVPLEIQSNLAESIWLCAVFGSESLFCFLVARLSLDFALQRLWLQPF